MDESQKKLNKALVILGPTATGKTDLGILLAKKYGGELLVCDSRQVYQGLDIGTGKLPGKYHCLEKRPEFWLLDGVKIWGHDLIDPDYQFSVNDYIKFAERAIKKIQTQNKLPIIVGGTGLYLKALLKGLDNLSVPVDFKLRQSLTEKPLSELQAILIKQFSQKWQDLNQSDRSNKRRLIRAVELASAEKSINPQDSFRLVGWDVLKIGLTASLGVLRERINVRLKNRIDQGLIEEGEYLYQHGLSLRRMRELGLEYGVMADLLEGEITREEFSQQLETKIWQYVKRQLTWFKKESDVNWFNLDDGNIWEKVTRQVAGWYDAKVND